MHRESDSRHVGTTALLLLTHAYYLSDDQRERSVMRPYPPLGLLSIAAYVEREGFDVEVFDTTFASFDALMAHLRLLRPGCLGIYVTLMTRARTLETIGAIRADPALCDTTIVLGGPEVTFHASRLIEHGADVVVVGEGEVTMTEVMIALREGEDLSTVNGIAFKSAQGEIAHTPARSMIRDIDTLPIPKRDAIDLSLYMDAWRARHGSAAISISTMRGCPFTCRWCSRAVYGESYRRRSPPLVVDEMELIRDRWNPEFLWFVDDVFTISSRWTEEFSAEVRHRDARIPYECITRADRLDEHTADLLAESGAYRVWIGAESGSQRVLNAMDRRVTVEQVRRSIALCRERGIGTGTFIMLGYPGEHEDDIRETIDHLRIASPDLFTITLAYPIVGTPFYEQVREQIVETEPWENSSDRDLRYPRTYSDAFYRHALRRIVNEVEFSKLRQSGRGFSARSLSCATKAIMSRIGMLMTR